MLDTVLQQGLSGCLFQSLRYRNRDGGFYWHSDPIGTNGCQTYHWPGFPSTDDDYGEPTFLALVQHKAFEIRGLPVPALRPPQPPRLLPISDHGAISWQGSVGATGYSVDRGWHPEGPWFAAGVNIREDAVQYRPLFADTQPAFRRQYYYRVAAANEAGISSPSNVVGPVDVRDRVLVDPLNDLSLVVAHEGDGIKIETGNARRFKEDLHRLAGKTGDWFAYVVDGDLKRIDVDAFYEDTVAELQFAVLSAGGEYRDIKVQRTDYSPSDTGHGMSGWRPVRYEAEVIEPARQLRIRFTGDAQVSHVVLRYAFSALNTTADVPTGDE
jgi:hypothetical protein